jgi:hypothetical protein
VLPGTALLDGGFTLAALKQRLLSREYPVVHIASHGVFGDSADDTFIMTYDELLTLDGLQALLRDPRPRGAPIELITLSACQTAEGDDRAPLGMSGTAIKARARSALGTLWPVSDAAASTLMAASTSACWPTAGTARSALREAQLELLKHPAHAPPLPLGPVHPDRRLVMKQHALPAPLACCSGALLATPRWRSAAPSPTARWARCSACQGRFTVPQSAGHAARRQPVPQLCAASASRAANRPPSPPFDPGHAPRDRRVTGGEASLLQGPLRLQAAGGSAAVDFWLVNPNGIAVGAGAQLRRARRAAPVHVGAAAQLTCGRHRRAPSVAGSTWHWLHLVGGDIGLQSRPRGRGTLSVAAPEAGPALTLQAAALRLPTGIGSSAYAGPAGGIAVRAAGDVDVRSGAGISSYSVGAADAAPLTLDVGRLNVEGRGADGYGSSVVAMAAGSGRGAALTLRASDSVRVGPQGAVSTTTLDSGAAGTLSVSAPRVEVIGNGADSTTIESLSGGSLAGRGGDVRIDAGQLTVSHGGSIATDSYSRVGRAGDLVVTADQVLVDGGGRATALRSLAFGERGDAGAVQVIARQGLTLRAGGSLAVMSLGQGRPGSIAVQAGTLLIDGTGASDTVTGIGGDAIVDGAAGPVSVQAQRIDIREGGKISSGTLSNQDGGSVQVLADSLRIDGGSGLSLTGIMSDSTVGRGNAGSVSVRARQIEMLADGQISSAAIDINGSLDGPARGGQVSVHADTLAMASRSGIYSLAGTAGGAGNVDITVTGALSLTGGAGIVANTGGVGPAGTVTVRSGSLSLSGSDVAANLRSRIGSRATEGSGGQPGTVDITVSGATTLADGAALNVANNARVADAAALRPSRLTLRSGTLAMTDAEITAAATVNANAGALVVSTGGDLKLVRSVVSTSAVDGDGGSVSVTAGGTATLRDARITTSVEGQRNGNGGDISLTAAALVMQSGMVQANTEAPLARGGRITVATGVLLPDGSRVAVGGNRIEDFSPGVPGRNVIQAAAPDGVGGTLAVTLPQLDLAASLVYLITPRIGSTGLQRNLCEADGDSRLVLQGRGGLWPTSAGPVSVQP